MQFTLPSSFGLPGLTLSKGGGGVTFPTLAEIIAISGMEVAFSFRESGAAYQERTGASATTPSGDGNPIGSAKNVGSLGSWLTAADNAQRPVLHTGGGLWWAEGDGIDDLLSGALGAFRNTPEWRLFLGLKNTGTTAANRQAVNVVGATATRATAFFGQTSGNVTGGGRRQNAESFATVAGSPYPSEAIVLTVIASYTDTDCIIRVNGAQTAINASWLTAGNSDNDGGNLNLFSGSGVGGWFKGNIYCCYGHSGTLSADNLNLIERRVAYETGITLT
jgi:hypothetical protein